MNKDRKTIAIDMDGVLADIEVQFMDWYESEYGIRVRADERLGVPEPEGFPDQNAIKRYVYTPGFFRTIPLMEGAVEAVRTLMEDYEIFIVSAAMEFPQCLSEKMEWLQEHFPFISWKNIIFCGDKRVIATDYMIDDHCKNLDFCMGKPILFHASHNVNQHHHLRVRSWNEVLDIFEKENAAKA